jgi:hypothetical protein
MKKAALLPVEFHSPGIAVHFFIIGSRRSSKLKLVEPHRAVRKTCISIMYREWLIICLQGVRVIRALTSAVAPEIAHHMQWIVLWRQYHLHQILRYRCPPLCTTGKLTSTTNPFENVFISFNIQSHRYLA